MSKLRYMLDTNTASYVIKGNIAAVRKHLLAVPVHEICISVITQAELLFGVERMPENKGLQAVAHEFLVRVDVLPWDEEAALHYARLRALLERVGKVIGNMDMMIAAHAQAAKVILVSNDQSFRSIAKHMKEFALVNWAVS